MAKQSKYSSKKTDGDLEELSEKLANDLRFHIRTLSHCPLLSDSWCDMADVLGRVASVSDVESKLAAGKDDATLWETEELALRYLLEDGKLNLCLRNLIEYKTFQRDTLKNPSSSSIPADKVDQCDKFEKGLGVVLRNAWNHVEAVQTTDIQALVNHIADVLDYGLINEDYITQSYDKGDLAMRQEVMVYYYLIAILNRLDELHEDRIMPILRDRHIFMQGVKFLNKYHEYILTTPTLKMIEALSLITASEDYSTYKEQYVTSSSDASELLSLQENILNNYRNDTAIRSIMRPLVDSINQMKRRYRLK
mmetsp:Transcript_2818/g.2810  ORF Transcript_2818/g.2810 Transcript_2818/m.2810 type:complete len:308 (-) Transcript_2818:59-982(-)|eukprot:CAMPEP_0174824994 /NCGR_PEP_ID=MMETSP1107-20130205/40588_1 /TAXON_ID=36770 /ORGANISM="Paraphysomonas vestita, Strain GFlagA" /LENGTH=307 /DNA_ID=CAMNT_0016055401 /DNA_START=27 /DNA_END=950 /DNA_ORIENTATION=+